MKDLLKKIPNGWHRLLGDGANDGLRDVYGKRGIWWVKVIGGVVVDATHFESPSYVTIMSEEELFSKDPNIASWMPSPAALSNMWEAAQKWEASAEEQLIQKYRLDRPDELPLLPIAGVLLGVLAASRILTAQRTKRAKVLVPHEIC